MLEKFYDGFLVGVWISGIGFGLVFWACLASVLFSVFKWRPKLKAAKMSAVENFRKHNPHIQGLK